MGKMIGQIRIGKASSCCERQDRSSDLARDPQITISQRRNLKGRKQRPDRRSRVITSSKVRKTSSIMGGNHRSNLLNFYMVSRRSARRPARAPELRCASRNMRMASATSP